MRNWREFEGSNIRFTYIHLRANTGKSFLLHDSYGLNRRDCIWKVDIDILRNILMTYWIPIKEIYSYKAKYVSALNNKQKDWKV